jgi:ABC-2 type transport system ATP-binding protein
MGITVQSLTKVYDDQKAIDDISFTINKGEIVGFLGPNGAGKTTTMKILTCFLPPTSGTATLDSYNIFDHPNEIRQRIGYLPEHNPLYLDMYVHEYLRFVGELYRIPRGEIKKRIEEVIEMTGLGPEQHKQIGMLSKGYRQRAGLAQALIHDPEVLILDEPTSGLDPNQIIDIRNLIREAGKNKTIIFSTHILTEVEAIADRVIIINKGKIIADEKTEILRVGQNENVLFLEFEKEGFDFSRIREVNGVKEVVSKGKNQYQVVTVREIDIRRTVFEESVKQDNPIFQLIKIEKSLEDVFRTMTQKGF